MFKSINEKIKNNTNLILSIRIKLLYLTSNFSFFSFFTSIILFSDNAKYLINIEITREIVKNK